MHAAPSTTSPEPFAYSRIFGRAFELHLAFFRDVTPDVRFACDLFRERRRRAPGSAMEIQCGPAYYAHACSRMGLQAAAVDTRRDFLEFARGLEPTLPVDYRCEDLRHLAAHRQFDVLFLALDSFAYLLTDDDVRQFFASAARCMNDESILLVEANHPKDVGYIDYGQIYTGRCERFPRSSVRAEWGINQPKFDLLTGLVNTRIRLTVRHEGKEEERVIDSCEKQFFPREVQLLAGSTSLRLVDVLGGYSPRRLTWGDPVQVYVLERRAA
jgi:hypothetical protein